MIYSLTGTLTVKEPGALVVECCGVGYRCAAPLSTVQKLPPVGEQVSVLTHMSVREDAVELFAFADKEELTCFKRLISVSGVGPRVALAILSDIPPDRFNLYVVSGDVKAITKAQGVGPKLAQRIVLELKDKVELAGGDGSCPHGRLRGHPAVPARRSAPWRHWATPRPRRLPPWPDWTPPCRWRN